MSENTTLQQTVSNLSHSHLQSLIATSTGFVDVYNIPVFDDSNMLLPQNMILSAMNVIAGSEFVEWHNHRLPVYNVCSPDVKDPTALVIEANTESSRFVILADEMPTTMRLRISQVKDLSLKTPKRVFQYVAVNDVSYQIPNIEYLQKALFL